MFVTVSMLSLLSGTLLHTQLLLLAWFILRDFFSTDVIFVIVGTISILTSKKFSKFLQFRRSIHRRPTCLEIQYLIKKL